ncbi:neuromedin-U receptor 1 [Aplysia californica]|uniref:Neuromedin-U receptor 1 n=1 Tax=Aplysia californica TaxID=6500 RepID=A0ABM0JI98_APLCA|nr:neuromedin-U receptor 1 [Aplysia californica]
MEIQNHSSLTPLVDRNGAIDFEKSDLLPNPNVTCDVKLLPSPNLTRLVILLMAVPVCVAGFGANAINLVVFWHQGFRESVNVSLFSLAFSDMLNLMFLVVYALVSADLELGYLHVPPEIWVTCTWIIYSLTLNSCCTAVFISVERCLCATLPFKVKQIITPCRSAITMAAIFLVCVAATISPVFSLFGMSWERNPGTNKSTIVINVHFGNTSPVVYIVTNIVCTSLQVASFICLLVSTGTLMLALRRKTKWRLKMTYMIPRTVTNSRETLPSLEKRAGKMVVIVSAVFIVCFAPAQAIPITYLSLPEFYYGRRYGYAYGVCWAVSYFLYSVNSSVNLIIYYNMSSRYRDTLGRLVRQDFSCLHSRK